MRTKPIVIRDNITLRVLAAVAFMPNGCWEYRKNMVGIVPYKYPTVRWREDGKILRFLAHRYSYTAEYGPIPEGLIVDHKCRNNGCIRPDHLQAITQDENMALRGERQETCKNGHPHIPENRNGQGNCRPCARQYQRDRKDAIKRGETYSSLSGKVAV